MATAFVKDAEPVSVPAHRARFAAPPDLQYALDDLKREGISNLKEIAMDYNLNPTFLMNQFIKNIPTASY